MKILVLSAAPNSYATQSIVKAGEKRGHTMLIKDPSYLYLLISDKVSGFDRVYDGYGQNDKPVRLKAYEIDAVIPRIGHNLAYGCAVLEHLNNNLRIFSTQTSIGIKTAADKLISQQKISQAKIRVPQTIFGDRAKHPAWMVEQVGGLPSIAKCLSGSRGQTVYPLNDEYQTNVFLKNFSTNNENLLLQNFIDSGATDIRAIVIDGKVVVAMERTAAKGELRANISQGGSGRKIELSEDDKQMCIKAAKACGIECAGVDLMKSKSGLSYLIEINGNYGYHVEKITKVDISTPLIQYCEKNYKSGNKVNNETTARFFNISMQSSSTKANYTASKSTKVVAKQSKSDFPDMSETHKLFNTLKNLQI